MEILAKTVHLAGWKLFVSYPPSINKLLMTKELGMSMSYSSVELYLYYTLVTGPQQNFSGHDR